VPSIILNCLHLYKSSSCIETNTTFSVMYSQLNLTIRYNQTDWVHEYEPHCTLNLLTLAFNRQMNAGYNMVWAGYIWQGLNNTTRKWLHDIEFVVGVSTDDKSTTQLP